MANFTFHRSSLVYKRLPQQVNTADQITNYDLDNLYPQRLKELHYRSPLTKQAVSIQKDFYDGEGFENNGDVVVNGDGWTVADLLNFVSEDFSLFNGFALFFNYDANGNIVEAYHLPFEYVRFGLPDLNGKHSDVKVSNNWERSTLKTINGSIIDPVSYPIFNQSNAQAQVLTGTGGQVLYYTGVPDMYPLASLDAVADSTQADAEIQQFELNNSANGFHGATILKTPGEFEDEHEERIFNMKVNDTLGSSSPGIMTVQMDYEEMAPNLFESIPADNKDKLFETTFKHISRRIMQNYSIPPALLGVSPEGAVFAQQDIQDSYIYYNNKTKNQRAKIARIFNTWGQFWAEGALDFGEIIEQEFKKPVFEQRVLDTAEETVEENVEETVEEATEARLENIYGKRHAG